MKKFDLGIKADFFLQVVPAVKIESNWFLGIKNGKILVSEPWKQSFKKDSKKLLEAINKVCIPGLINGHTHLPMTLFRGLEDDVPFHVWLFERILPLEGRMVSKEFVKDGTELAALECLRFGTTTVNEMYFYAEETAKVLQKAGLRGIVSQTLADFPLPEDKDLGTDKFAILEKLQKKFPQNSRVQIGLGPHAPYSCSDELLKKVRDAADKWNMPIHIHVSETKKEVEDSLAKFGMSPVKRLEKLNFLSSRVHCAHCVHFSEEDKKIFERSGATIIHNPDSNAKLGSGIAPIADYVKRKIPVGFGTDGSASNNDLSLFGAMDLGTKLQKLENKDTTAFTAAQAIYAATIGGAKAIGLDDQVGSLCVGKQADFVFVDLNLPHMQPTNNIMSHLVYSAQGQEVSLVAVAGKILYQDGKYFTLNPKQIFQKAEKWRKKIAKNLELIR
jgi:5-methylthioadenosine/S-adenosylhomocysteine deaminase